LLWASLSSSLFYSHHFPFSHCHNHFSPLIITFPFHFLPTLSQSPITFRRQKITWTIWNIKIYCQSWFCLRDRNVWMIISKVEQS
jgi:hypothetical protein